jgi:hypothetical protein
VVGSDPTHSGAARAPRRQPAPRAANPHLAPPDRTSRPGIIGETDISGGGRCTVERSDAAVSPYLGASVLTVAVAVRDLAVDLLALRAYGEALGVAAGHPHLPA